MSLNLSMHGTQFSFINRRLSTWGVFSFAALFAAAVSSSFPSPGAAAPLFACGRTQAKGRTSGGSKPLYSLGQLAILRFFGCHPRKCNVDQVA